jgi:hypothetical protein
MLFVPIAAADKPRLPWRSDTLSGRAHLIKKRSQNIENRSPALAIRPLIVSIVGATITPRSAVIIAAATARAIIVGAAPSIAARCWTPSIVPLTLRAPSVSRRPRSTAHFIHGPFNDLLKLALIEPDPMALRTIVDFEPLFLRYSHLDIVDGTFH